MYIYMYVCVYLTKYNTFVCVRVYRVNVVSCRFVPCREMDNVVLSPTPLKFRHLARTATNCCHYCCVCCCCRCSIVVHTALVIVAFVVYLLSLNICLPCGVELRTQSIRLICMHATPANRHDCNNSNNNHIVVAIANMKPGQV